MELGNQNYWSTNEVVCGREELITSIAWFILLMKMPLKLDPANSIINWLVLTICLRLIGPPADRFNFVN